MKKMKKIYMCIIAMMMCLQYSLAQDTLTVESGQTTLNDAISQNLGTKIYKLKAGGWYGLTAPLENSNFHLQIVGESISKNGIYTTVQNGQDVGGVVFSTMINAIGPVTLKNIYFMNTDILGQRGGIFLNQIADGENSRIVIDNCIVDPMGKSNLLNMTGLKPRAFLTNNIFIRHGHIQAVDDGHVINYASADLTSGIDTLWVENNTFVSSGTNFLSAGLENFVNNFIWLNHNTFVNHKSQLDWMKLENKYYFTNNLMFNFMGNPWQSGWDPMPGNDQGYILSSLLYTDTLPNEVLPSQRVEFIQYNNHHRCPGLYALLDEINNDARMVSKNKLHFQPLLWDTEPQKSQSREAQMFGSPNFPNFKLKNNMKDLDPGFEDARIYAYSDSFVKWERPATYTHPCQITVGIPPANQWANWHWDPDGDESQNIVFPVFNGKYTNTSMKKASIEKMPLGDLNWWKTAKILWISKQSQVQNHILALNENQIDIGYNGEIEGINDHDRISIATQVYPNPFTSTVTISYALQSKTGIDITIYDALGQPVKNILNTTQIIGTHQITWDGTNNSGASVENGFYFYVIKGNDSSFASGRLVMMR